MRRAALALVSIIAATPGALAGETYTFDAARFEKKRFELGGYVEAKRDQFRFNEGSAFYRLNVANLRARSSLDRSSATLKLTGKARAGDWLLTARTHSTLERDHIEHASEHRFDELALAWKPSTGFALDIGKSVLKWGKGYAWNPVGFVERPKDPGDPELAREGYTVIAADIVRSFSGPLQTIAFTPLLLPVDSQVNDGYGKPGHLNIAAKLYLLYRDTDIGFYFLGEGSRSRRIGADFSRNLGANLEIHGEWARIAAQEFALTDADGNVERQTRAVTSALIGLRYLSERETTYIVELYRNGTGFTGAEFRSFVALVDRAVQAQAAAALIERAQSIAQAYARPNALRNYVYVRASQKEPFDILYFTPSITAIVNLSDGSYSLSPELLYAGRKNWELRARAVLLGGGRATDFGAKQNERRIEAYARWHF